MEHSNPPAAKNPHYAIHNKPSTPIEIPRRCRPILSVSSSPIGRPMSPELLFEMSPITSDFPSPPAYSLGLRKSREPEPFLYHFPAFPARRHPFGLRTQASSHNALHSGTTPHPPSTLSVSTVSNATNRHPLPCRLEDDDISPVPLASSRKPNSTIKMTGFSPSTPIQPLVSRQNRSPGRSWKHNTLSPPPRSSSYSSSPWILPGKSDLTEEDLTYLEADPSAFDFEKYLMRRIENQNHICFREISLTSIRG